MGESATSDLRIALALGLAGQALARLEEPSESETVRAIALWNAGRGYAGEARLSQHLESHPDDVDARHAIAWMCFQRGSAEEAFGHAVRGLDIAPSHVGLSALHAEALIFLGRYEDAVRAIDHLDELVPGAVQIDELRAHLALRSRDWKAARDLAHRARERGAPPVVMRLIESIAAERDGDRASAARTALEITSQEPENLLGWGRLIRVVQRALFPGRLIPGLLILLGIDVLVDHKTFGPYGPFGGAALVVGALLMGVAQYRRRALPDEVLQAVAQPMRRRAIRSAFWAFGGYAIAISVPFIVYVVTADPRSLADSTPPWGIFFVVGPLGAAAILLRLNGYLRPRRRKLLDAKLSAI